MFVVGVVCNSTAVKDATSHTAKYCAAVQSELKALEAKVLASGLTQRIRVLLLYVPLGDKAQLVEHFDLKLKGLQ